MADGNTTNRDLITRLELALLGGAALMIVIALAALLLSQWARSRHDAWLDSTFELRDRTRGLAVQAQSVTRGLPPDFAQIRSSIEAGQLQIDALRQGNGELGVEALPLRLQDELTKVDQAWGPLRQRFESLLAGQAGYEQAVQSVTTIDEAVTAIATQLGQLIDRLAAGAAPAAELRLAAAQQLRLERIRQHAQGALRFDQAGAGRLQQLDAEVGQFRRGLRALDTAAREAAAEAVLEQASQAFGGLTQAAATIVNNGQSIAGIREAAFKLTPQSAALIDTVDALDTAVREGATGLPAAAAYLAGGLAIVLLAAYIAIMLQGARERQRRAEEQEQRQQTAILKLLDDITNLADGDLTVDVTVTEDFTGAIADSINYTVDTLRRLVGTINATSVEIAAAASSTQETAQKMNQASERQAREIGAITNAITQTSHSLTQVAARAEQLAQQATNSVQVAHNGAATVGRTIQGMAALREQIQDTAKRIKRLGESSQEIGNIIEFINDIAEQTNTLALNASIQAAMAGEAGRGFAVVADEVHSLAERSASATRQIENLVKTIQADTNEAIISMERSTANVVSGAASAEEAGQALTRIESTSTELSRLIQEIAVAARAQSANSTRIAGQMQLIRDIAVETSGSAGQTAQAVGELTTLSEKLRESVAGFKLPADISLNTGAGY